MKKAFLFVLTVMIFFSCKKSDTSGGSQASPSANFVKKIVVHFPGQPVIDTAVFTYDNLGRLAQYYEVNADTTTTPAFDTSYYFDNLSFIYTGNNTTPTEYAYYDLGDRTS